MGTDRYTAKMASKLGFQNLRRLNQALSTVRQYSAGSGAYSEHAKSAAAWKNAFYFLGAPAVALVYINAFHILPQHPEREEFVAYPHPASATGRSLGGRMARRRCSTTHTTTLCLRATRKAVRSCTTATRPLLDGTSCCTMAPTVSIP